MVDTMPKDNASSQSEMNSQPALPRWVRVVRMAVVVMSVLIVLGLGLLAYGLITGVNRLASSSSDDVFEYPADAELTQIDLAPDGDILLFFEHNDTSEIIIIDPDSTEITTRLRLRKGEEYRFTQP